MKSIQRTARVAGFAYLFFIVGSLLHFSIIEINLIVSENTGAIAHFIQTHELQFRLGIVGDLIIFMTGIILAQALYVMLKIINKDLALLALILMLIQAALLIVIELTSFIALFFLNDNSYLTVFETEQLQALVGLFLKVRAAGYGLSMLFFCPALIIFSYLFFKSKYIPKILAVWGIFSLLLMLIMTLAKIIIPDGYIEMLVISAKIGLVSNISYMLFQITIGFWLLFKGVNVEPWEKRALKPA